MNIPSILRHSKAHRAAAVRNAAELDKHFETRFTLECSGRNAAVLMRALHSSSCRIIQHCSMSYGLVTQFIVAVDGGKSLLMDASGDLFRVVKTEKVRK